MNESFQPPARQKPRPIFASPQCFQAAAQITHPYPTPKTCHPESRSRVRDRLFSRAKAPNNREENFINECLSSGHGFSRAKKNAVRPISFCALSARAFAMSQHDFPVRRRVCRLRAFPYAVAPAIIRFAPMTLPCRGANVSVTTNQTNCKNASSRIPFTGEGSAFFARQSSQPSRRKFHQQAPFVRARLQPCQKNAVGTISSRALSARALRKVQPRFPRPSSRLTVARLPRPATSAIIRLAPSHRRPAAAPEGRHRLARSVRAGKNAVSKNFLSRGLFARAFVMSNHDFPVRRRAAPTSSSHLPRAVPYAVIPPR
jgi:hypothetical protein